MRKAIGFTPPYGTVFTMMKGGSIVLMYDDSAIPTKTMVDWLQGIVDDHKQQIAPKQVKVEVTETKVLPIIPKPKPVTVPKEHDWGGPYKLGAECKTCKAKADGMESKECR